MDYRGVQAVMESDKIALIGVIILVAILWGIGLYTSEHADDTYYCADDCGGGLEELFQ